MLQLRDSYLWHCGKRMAVWPGDEEGQAVVSHACLHCGHVEQAPGQRARRAGSPAMAGLRDRLWSEVTP